MSSYVHEGEMFKLVCDMTSFLNSLTTLLCLLVINAWMCRC